MPPRIVYLDNAGLLVDDGAVATLIETHRSTASAHHAKTGSDEVYGLIRVGTDAAKPAAGTAGRFYWATDTEMLYRDTGVAWAETAGGGTPTKEFFATVSEGAATLGDFGADRVWDGSVGVAFVQFTVPHDFTAITSAELIIVSDATKVDMNIDISSDYGGDGEAYNAHSEADAATTYNLTANQLYYLDISGILSALAPGDIAGISLICAEPADGINIYVIGVRFRYT